MRRRRAWKTGLKIGTEWGRAARRGWGGRIAPRIERGEGASVTLNGTRSRPQGMQHGCRCRRGRMAWDTHYERCRSPEMD